MKIICNLIIWTFLFTENLACQAPFKYWSFDDKEFLIDRISHTKIDTVQYKGKIKLISGVKSTGADFLSNEYSIVVTNGLRNAKDEFSISFFLKGQTFTFQTFPASDIYIQFEYPYFVFKSTALYKGNVIVDNWKIDLKGTGIESYDYYTDDNWHQLTFSIDLKAGVKRIFVDGKTTDLFEKNISKGGQILTSSADGFKQTDFIDELAFYNFALDKKFVLKQFEKFAVKPFEKKNKEISRNKDVRIINGYSNLDFAPGYPNYNIQALDQLKEFPDPRYSPNNKLLRNFSWMDIAYLHRELPGIGGKGFGNINPDRAIQLSKELYERWNYYFEIPVLRNNESELNKIYNDKGSVPGALIDFARRNPTLKTSGILMQVQNKPVHAGLELSNSYVTSQKLPEQYYLRDNHGKPFKFNGRYWISPLAPLDFIYNDAITSSYYLSQVQKYLGRPIDILSENGEYFGHIRNKSLLERDPDVKEDFEKRKLSIFDYNGWFQNRLDTAYKNEILRRLNWTKTAFNFYNISAIQPEYWPSYSFRRTSNEVVNSNHYSTPDFYPGTPGNWQQNSGQYNGYGVIADGRKREIALGDKFFAPFVSAGWGFEENNIRPAQWLGLLKSMMMLGAEYYHVGYFNITGQSGWLDGKGPFDPRGYIYQAAMPSYAQAIFSRAYKFIDKGILLNPQENLPSKLYSYRFKGLKPNHLILVRKLGNEYLIYGSIQQVSNKAGQVNNEENTKIDLEGIMLEFKIRRQGSVYIFNSSKKTFIQLDGWHQHEHPFYWSKDYKIEAEMADEIVSDSRINTTGINKSGIDYSDFATTVSIPSRSNISFFIDLNKKLYGISLYVKNLKGKSSIIKVSIGDDFISKKVESNFFTLVKLTSKELEKFSSNNSNMLRISTLEGDVEIDYLTLNFQ